MKTRYLYVWVAVIGIAILQCQLAKCQWLEKKKDPEDDNKNSLSQSTDDGQESSNLLNDDYQITIFRSPSSDHITSPNDNDNSSRIIPDAADTKNESVFMEWSFIIPMKDQDEDLELNPFSGDMEDDSWWINPLFKLFGVSEEEEKMSPLDFEMPFGRNERNFSQQNNGIKEDEGRPSQEYETKENVTDRQGQERPTEIDPSLFDDE